MRILYLNHNVVGSGTFLRAFHLGRELAAAGHQVTLVTTSRSARIGARATSRSGVHVIEAPDLWSGRARTGWDPYNTLTRISWLRRREFDVVHAFDSRPAVIYPALSVTQRNGTPLFMDWADWWGRGGWINERSGWAVRTFFGPIETWFEEAYRTRALGTTAISSALMERSVKLGVDREHVFHLQQGCDPETVVPRDRRQARERLGVPTDAQLVLHVGVLTPGDFKLLIDAFNQLRTKLPQAKLVIAGRTGMRIPPVADGVTVTGEVSFDALQDWLAAADVCAIPARDTIGNRGRWPSKLNDYLAAGRTVVMPRVGDAGEAVARHNVGYVSHPQPDSFAEALATALLDEDGRKAAEHNARKLAETEFAWPCIAADLDRFYRRMVSR